jgi:hypothetical protein
MGKGWKTVDDGEDHQGLNPWFNRLKRKPKKKKMKSRKYKYYLSILSVFMINALAFAQDPQPPPGFDDSVTDLVPLDGGLTILLAAGVITYGLKKIYDTPKDGNKGGHF